MRVLEQILEYSDSAALLLVLCTLVYVHYVVVKGITVPVHGAVLPHHIRLTTVAGEKAAFRHLVSEPELAITLAKCHFLYCDGCNCQQPMLQLE